jgi:enoyl-[acyl-carrier protein] reductase/trans-2-enoyl-CoA reductase (NAD+)
VRRRWPLVTTENLDALADLPGFRSDFLRIFGFGIDGVNYDGEQDPFMGRPDAG